MTARLQRARPGGPDLQARVDEPAERLGRSVAIDDPLVRMAATSRHPGDEDPVRTGTLPQGRTDTATVRHIGLLPRFAAERTPGARPYVFASDVANSPVPLLENPPAFDAVVEKSLAEEPANAA
ncbi:hypothetical protein [Streptomyces zaomyceticus]|uniref:hypothetical protein n=1 Tax=Streptomyces zaomyceticus TaxID=68286 RepID=UPI00341CB9A0